MIGEKDTIFDVAVIGGGPAGMMAAIKAGESGAKVLLLEKNEGLGKKLLLSGKGRANITQAEFNPKILAEEYSREGDFLLFALSNFGVRETIDFFEKEGLKTKIERGKRVFPESDRAGDVLKILINLLKKSKVEILTEAEVKKLIKRDNLIEKIILSQNREVSAKNYILATGGKSYPKTGSTGSGYFFAKELGHTVIKPRPALVPLKIKESWPKKAQGLTLKNVKLEVFQSGKKKDSRFGEMLFTHFGISGPIVLDLSKRIGELLEKGEVKLFLDLKPALDFSTLEKRIQRDFLKYQNKLFKNSLSDLLPRTLISIIIEKSLINPEKPVNQITLKERQNLAKLLKSLGMTVLATLGFETAIVTAGGVSLKEIDSKTMKSKIIDNLYFAGEIISLDGPTGGYNLQLCWSTGYLAGQSAAE